LAGTDVVGTVVLERPRDPSHGDVACNVAMQLAKQLKMNPRELATKVVEALLANPARKAWWNRSTSPARASSTCA
jgi:arginyl-tRNA synthetase